MLKVNLDQPVLAMFVRFVIKEFVEWPCMRVEVYGTPASKSLKKLKNFSVDQRLLVRNLSFE